jgi:FRG domain-containing protein
MQSNDIVVSSWAELMNALYDIPRTAFQRYRSDFVYRGLADHSWGLETGLQRLCGDYVIVEGPMLRSFRKYAESGSIPADTLLVRLAVAQHHRLPTRVLDWTVSPKVALHFATAEEEHYDKDGVVWCVDVRQVRDLLPMPLQTILADEHAFLFSVEMLPEVKTLKDLDAFGIKHGGFALFFEPPSLDARIVNQGAIMSVMPGARLSLNDFLESYPQIYRRIVVPKELKWEVRDKLDQDNVTERMLFPGLDGLSNWLKRYYGPGPGKAAPYYKPCRGETSAPGPLIQDG